MDSANVKVSQTIKCVGTIDSVHSLKGNGGGWVFTAVLNDPNVIGDLGKGLKKVCVFEIGISETKKGSVSTEETGQLDLSDSIPSPAEE